MYVCGGWSHTDLSLKYFRYRSRRSRIYSWEIIPPSLRKMWILFDGTRIKSCST